MINNDEQLNNDYEQPQPTEQVEAEAEAVSEITGGQVNPPTKKHGKAEIILNVALWIVIAVLLVAVILRVFVFSTVGVDGASMNPTYDSGDVVTVNKTKLPKRGDVAVFYKNEVDNRFLAQFAKREQCVEGQPYEKLIKRVVAVAGDRIWVQRVGGEGADLMYQLVISPASGGSLLFEDGYVKKGEKLAQETFYLYTNKGYTDLGILKDCTESNPFVVSEGCFFAMGDNRINSRDSREFGEFKLSQMFGVVLDK